ncbi:hypothetical protein AG1IA_07117 [Rhizoctonia solani AG-1 IA]|uniref:Uncharacterized protein n=1 Tax=Thanatephorus cucumeris (strain AG1-IA) TaxID=983506 RepID=L8WL08_THACA|nr:hypothetical protein AG1IA_07117 [Rhizoctonia solani AG-1 IA]
MRGWVLGRERKKKGRIMPASILTVTLSAYPINGKLTVSERYNVFDWTASLATLAMVEPSPGVIVEFEPKRTSHTKWNEAQAITLPCPLTSIAHRAPALFTALIITGHSVTPPFQDSIEPTRLVEPEGGEEAGHIWRVLEQQMKPAVSYPPVARNVQYEEGSGEWGAFHTWIVDSPGPKVTCALSGQYATE